ncbi:MAG: glycosyl transferase, family 4 [Candidatus Solibacter sp.]|nr:glycosyl transferase, family 4 [Candidatus Solibacter sp.]
MSSIILVTAIAFALSLLFTRLVRDGSLRLGLVDLPDQRRKTHLRAVPRTGGVAIVAAYLVAYALLLNIPSPVGAIVHSGLPFFWRLLPATGAIFLTGLLDDVFHLKPWWKLAGQVGAGGLAYAGGLRIADFHGYSHFGWLSLPLTIGWLVLCSNAFNLIDGIDGLATGVGVVAGLTTLIAALLQGNIPLALAVGPLIGALCAFLFYNFNPASIFLGDSGSLLIGFLLGAYGIIWSQKSATMLGMAGPTMALALPLLEVGLSVFRRFLRNEPIFTADRGHIHHRLLDLGFTPRRAALMLYAACSIGAALSLLQSVVQNRLAGAVVLLFAACACGGIQYLGYVEFNATRRFLWAGLRPMLSAHVKLEAFERSLADSSSLAECWQSLEMGARELGYSRVEGELSGQAFGNSVPRRSHAAFWQMRLNLPDHDFVNITQREGAAEQPVLLIPFVEIVRRVLPAKLRQIEDATASLACLAAALEDAEEGQASPRNSRTTRVISSDCGAPSVNAATAS